MAQAHTHRDQGSLSSLVYSFFPAPASCQVPLPTVGLPSPCTVPVSLHFCLQPVQPLGLPISALLGTSLNTSRTLLSSHLHLSHPSCTSSNLPNSWHLNPDLPLPNFHCLCIFSHSFLPSLLYHLSFPLHTLCLFSPASSTLSILSFPKDPLLHFLATVYSAKTPAFRSGLGRAATSGEDSLVRVLFSAGTTQV